VIVGNPFATAEVGSRAPADRRCRLGFTVDVDRFAAALVDADGTVLASVEDVAPSASSSVVLPRALAGIMAQAGPRGVALDHVDQVMMAINEVDGRAGIREVDPDWSCWPGQLSPIGVVRLGAATTALPPLAGWPERLRSDVSVRAACVAGGAGVDGADFEPLDTAGLAAFARTVAGKVDAVVVSGVFAPVMPSDELAAAGLLRAELGDSVPILLSHEAGGAGLLPRENATVLQAVLLGKATGALRRLRRSMAQNGLAHAELFLARGDGSIMTADYGLTRSVQLHGAAKAVGAQGAAMLAGESNALVLFTTPDGEPTAVCAVAAGQARLASGPTDIAGVPTSVRSVAVVPTVPPVGGFPRTAADRIAEAVDRVKDVSGDLPLLVVGPGAGKLVDALPGAPAGTTLVCCPPRANAAVAVGAATALVTGSATRVLAADSRHGGDIRGKVVDQALAAAVHAGADPDRVEVIMVDEAMVARGAGPDLLLRVSAGGPPRTAWQYGRRRSPH